jgi:hypothetical protein
MLLVALVIGTSLSVVSTERIDILLVLSTSVSWAFVPVLQLLTGWILVRGVSAKVDAFAAYFGTHTPWSLWIIALHALFLVVAPAREAELWLALTAIVPATLTVRLLLELCEHELGLPPDIARRRVAVHQLASYALVGLYLNFAVALWPRLSS